MRRVRPLRGSHDGSPRDQRGATVAPLSDPWQALVEPGHAPQLASPAAEGRKPSRRYTGRPPAPPGAARTSALTVKVSDQDRHRIEQRALKAGLGVSTYVREAALKARVVPSRHSQSLSLAEIAQITQLNEVAVTIAREANRLNRPSALSPEVKEAFDKLSGLIDMMTDQVAARDRADALRQRMIAELNHIGRNLNQITRGVNAIARRRGTLDEALPPYTRAVLADIADLISRLPLDTSPEVEP
ncbi:plasmid mobilization protein [Leptospira interrogans]